MAYALDEFIPNPCLHEFHHVTVDAPCERAWAAARNFDMASLPIVRLLFALRTLPQRLRNATRESDRLRIKDITSSGTGFGILSERPGTSVTVGAIGKVWRPNIEFVNVPANGYRTFGEPGWVKVAWELRCQPDGDTKTLVVFELRVTATDERSWRRFERYFFFIGPFSRFIRRSALADLKRRIEMVVA